MGDRWRIKTNIEEGERLLNTKQIDRQCEYYSLSDEFKLPLLLNIIHLNARSLKNKLDELQTLLLSSNTEWSIICISETWLKSEIVKYYNLENYTLFASCRQLGEGVGTAIYVHNKFEATQRSDIAGINTENTFVEIKVTYKNGVKM